MKTIAMATRFTRRCRGAACRPSGRPTRRGARARGPRRRRARAEAVHELVALGLELDLDAVVALVHDLRVLRAGAELDAGDARELCCLIVVEIRARRRSATRACRRRG